MLPVFRRFNQQDIPTAPNWLGYVFNSLNVFAEQVVNTLNKNLVIGENVQGQKYSVTFITLPTYGAGDFTPITLQYKGGGQPTCLLLGQLLNADNTPAGVVSNITNWTLNLNRNPYIITVNYISGLTPSTKYTANLVVL